MTFIGITTSTDHAEIVTDTWSYSKTLSRLGRLSKVYAMPHLDGAVVVQGDVSFGALWAANVAHCSDSMLSMDDLNEGAQEQLRESRDALDDQRADSLGDALVLHVGFSPAAGRFTCTSFSSLDGFKPSEVTGPFVHPSPLTQRPSDYEVGWYRKALASDRTRYPDEATRERVEAAHRANLAGVEALPVGIYHPTTEEGWVALAEHSRATRSTLTAQSKFKVLVGGELHHTRLEHGSVTTRTIHRFNDSGDEFAAIMRGTLHPVGQQGPCPCGSEKTYRECCIAAEENDPCWCGGPLRLKDCCALPPDASPSVLEIAASGCGHA